MTLRPRARHALALCCFALLALAPFGARAAACGGDAGGIGGTGVQPATPAPKPPPGKGGKDRGGVGGTGISERDRGGVGGTGIVGVITGFGSVCVNGLEVAYDDASRIEADGAPLRPAGLAVGQVVVIDAVPRDGELWAERLEVRNAAFGPVASTDLRRGEIEVLGQRVKIDAATQLVGDGGAAVGLGAFAPGSFVAVSGLRRADGSVAATRVESTATRDRVSVSGPLAANARGVAAIGALEIVTAGDDAPTVAIGRAAFVSGRLDAQGALRADRVEPLAHFTPAPARLSIEGFVQTVNRDGFRTDLVDVDASQLGANAAVAAPDTRVVVSGPVGADGRLVAERIDVVTAEPPLARGVSDTEQDRLGRSGAVPSAGAAAITERPASSESESSEIPATIDIRETGASHDVPEPVEPPEVEHEHAETPEVEKPEFPEVERPETPEVETPEVERPELPEVEQPETPERPEIPELEAPERPEVPEIEKPEAPERPELPEIEKPEIPERPEPVERPELPEVERPETPERVEIPEPPELPEAPEPPERPESH